MATLTKEQQQALAIADANLRLKASAAPAPRQASVAAPSGMQQFRFDPKNPANPAVQAFNYVRDTNDSMGSVAGTARDMAIQGGAGMAGMAVGGPIGAGIGSALGNAVVQAIPQLNLDQFAPNQGNGKVAPNAGSLGPVGSPWLPTQNANPALKFNVPEMIGSGVAGAFVPGSKPLGTVATTVARDAFTAGAGSLAGKVAESELSGQGMPSMGDAASSFAAGAVGGGFGGALRGMAPVPFNMLSEFEKLTDQSRINFRNVRRFGAVMEPDLLGQSGIGSSLAETADLVGKAKTANAAAAQRAANSSLGLEPTVETFRPDKYVDLEAGGTRFEPGTLTDIAGSKSVQEPYNTIRDMRNEALKRISSGKRMTADTAEKMKAMASADVDALRLKRNEMVRAGRLASTSGSPEADLNYRKLSAEAAAMEKNIEDAAIKYGDEALVGRYRESRKLISKTHALDYATDGSGMVDANKLAANPGGFALSGELGDFANFTDSVNRLRKIKADSGMGLVSGAANLIRMLPGGGLAMNVLNRLGPNAAARSTLGESAQNALAAGRYTSGPNNLASSLARFSGMAAGQQNGPNLDQFQNAPDQ